MGTSRPHPGPNRTVAAKRAFPTIRCWHPACGLRWFRLALLSLVLGFAYALFDEGWKNEKKFRRNAEQIIQTTNAGERWRENIRAATGPLRVEETESGTVLHIPRGKSEVAYRFSQNGIWMRTGLGDDWKLVLDRVRKSEMLIEPRQRVQTARWEIELASYEQRRRVQPFFTFLAATGSAPIQTQ